MKDEWLKGNFIPKNKEKCINCQINKKIVYRSSWEKRFFVFADENKNVIKWGSELFEIPYYYDLDEEKKLHRYYPDIYCEILDNNNKLKKYLIEIKPLSQIEKPEFPKRKTKQSIKNYKYKVVEWIKNQNKWKHARMFCEGRDIMFKVLNEKEIF